MIRQNQGQKKPQTTFTRVGSMIRLVWLSDSKQSTSITPHPCAKGLNYHTILHPWNRHRRGHLQRVQAMPLKPLYKRPSKEECNEWLLGSLESLQLFRTESSDGWPEENVSASVIVEMEAEETASFDGSDGLLHFTSTLNAEAEAFVPFSFYCPAGQCLTTKPTPSYLKQAFSWKFDGGLWGYFERQGILHLLGYKKRTRNTECYQTREESSFALAQLLLNEQRLLDWFEGGEDTWLDEFMPLYDATWIDREETIIRGRIDNWFERILVEEGWLYIYLGKRLNPNEKFGRRIGKHINMLQSRGADLPWYIEGKSSA